MLPYRLTIVTLALLDLATTLPQIADEGGMLRPVLDHGGLAAFIVAKLAITFAVLGIGHLIERLSKRAAFVTYAICAGALLAAVGWNAAQFALR